MESLLSVLAEQGITCLNSICGFEFVRYKKAIVQCYSSLFYVMVCSKVCVIWIRTKEFFVQTYDCFQRNPNVQQNHFK